MIKKKLKLKSLKILQKNLKKHNRKKNQKKQLINKKKKRILPDRKIEYKESIEVRKK